MRTSQINPQIAINALMGYLREPKPEILVYYNTDEEYFTFNRLQDEPMADTSMAEDTYNLRWSYLLYLQRLTIANYVTPYKPSLS